MTLFTQYFPLIAFIIFIATTVYCSFYIRYMGFLIPCEIAPLIIYALNSLGAFRQMPEDLRRFLSSGAFGTLFIMLSVFFLLMLRQHLMDRKRIAEMEALYE